MEYDPPLDPGIAPVVKTARRWCAGRWESSEMGREIRQVPTGWEHPRNESGRYRPLYDETYEDAAAKWVESFIAWENGAHPDRAKTETRWFWEWEGGPPDEEYYRPAFTATADHFQIYETVSEGTPVSPVFATREELADWLVEQGTSREGSDAFAAGGWAPSGIFVPGRGFLSNYEALTEGKK